MKLNKTPSKKFKGFQKIVYYFIYIRFCYNAVTSQLSIFDDIYVKVGILVLLLKSFEVDFMIAGIVIVIIIPLILLLGHLLLNHPKISIQRIERTVANHYDPQIQKILRNTKK